MEQEQGSTPTREEQKPKKKKLGKKEIFSIILIATVAVLAKTAVKTLFSKGSSSSGYEVEVDLDIPEREPIDYGAIIDEAFEQAETN